MMIGETATIDGLGKSSPPYWIEHALQALPATFPKIKAFLWFNWNIFEKGKEWEWPIEWTSEGQQTFAREIASPYFAADEFGEPTQLTPIQALP